jgi:FdhD protein
VLGERKGIRWQGGVSARSADAVVAETTYELYLDGVLLSRAVVSPADLREWGAGHVICEGLIEPGETAEVEIEGERIRVRSRAGTAGASESLALRSSAYLGRLDLGDLQPLISSQLRVSATQVEEYARAISELAPGWQRTGGLHVALLYDSEGRLIKAAEDIGRHNALDKVVGSAHLQGIDRSRCVVVLSGRMPQGMVAKVVRSGIPIAVTKAASSDAGIDLARQFGLTLICFARPGRFTVYSGEERVLL